MFCSYEVYISDGHMATWGITVLKAKAIKFDKKILYVEKLLLHIHFDATERRTY